jgi:hypothetical protein
LELFCISSTGWRKLRLEEDAFKPSRMGSLGRVEKRSRVKSSCVFVLPSIACACVCVCVCVCIRSLLNARARELVLWRSGKKFDLF